MNLGILAVAALCIAATPAVQTRDTGRNYEVFYRRSGYNFALYYVPALAYDMNATGVGHSLAYEDLVIGKTATLETKTFARIDRVLRQPPKLPPSEKALAPTFARRFGRLEQLFDWAHTLHFQTMDVLADTRLTRAQQEAEIERLYQNYRTSVPFALTPLPMNMGYLYGQPYSKRFRDRFPKVNGLFWGYHWLQGAAYDLLYGKTRAEQNRAYALLGKRYRTVELYRTDRSFMPMVAELSPRFAARFPELANVFDNLHMLHDTVNDILASPELSRAEQDTLVQKAIEQVLERTHAGELPGRTGEGLHDHRFVAGMPGMGLMPVGVMEAMRPGECHHCAMGLATGAAAWRVSSVTAQGMSMRVRCALCARDYALETPGEAILHLATEDPDRPVVVFVDDKGEMTTDFPNPVFLEVEGSHADCNAWSQAFTSRAAFDRFVAQNPQYRGATPLSLAAWAERQGKKPDTLPGRLP